MNESDDLMTRVRALQDMAMGRVSPEEEGFAKEVEAYAKEVDNYAEEVRKYAEESRPPPRPEGTKGTTEESNDEAYASLRSVLDRAYYQASQGKGRERHAQDKPFNDQPMQRLLDLYGPGFAAGQAGKKLQEALRLPRERAVQELLGAIVYVAGLVVWMEKGQ